MALDVNKHQLIPKHSKLTDAERKKFLDDYKIDVKSLPKILIDDAAIITLKPKAGDIIKIERKSETAGTSVYYRAVIDG
ncbi:DNA-directed RNA polymerase subunit H [Candidatus Woesearchaeota archaeon]|jgi:DNA-directed RNA polymerase subunit H|nr:DNA-directed RNA polymerase subunit H [Candidatus Woesearchaeota archaeon]MBT5342901.1 DNA-directed RNA polymerase subunit H [Candidatus Woesearchaeota archaeon]